MSDSSGGPQRNVQDAVPSPPRGWMWRLGSFCLHQLAALAVFVGFPALVTAIAPVSWITFERRDGQVTATTKTCLLFVVPYKTRTVSPVIGIGDRFVEGTVTRHRQPGPDRRTKSEDEGFLVIKGEDQVAEVSVTPFNLKSVIARSEAFVNDGQAKELKLFVVANWKFSVLAGGLISLLTVFYLFIVVSGATVKLVHFLQGLAGVPPERRLFAKHV